MVLRRFCLLIKRKRNSCESHHAFFKDAFTEQQQQKKRKGDDTSLKGFIILATIFF